MEYKTIDPGSGYDTEKGLVEDLLWLFKGFIYPCWSSAYYREASGRPLLVAAVFLFSFALLQASVSLIRITIVMQDARNEITQAYERGEIPSLRIENGIASVDGSQPFVFSDKRQFFGIDTTGEIREIDTESYSEGFLITRTDIHVVNQNGYQVLPLRDLHEIFGNPIVIDKTQVLDLWNKAAIVIDFLAFVGLFFWHSLGRFAYIALIGLIIWGVVSTQRQGTRYRPILITGIYANVPTIYIIFVLGRIGVSFTCLNSILLIVLWAIALLFVLKVENADLDTLDSGSAPKLSI